MFCSLKLSFSASRPLGAWVPLLPLEGFNKALTAQVLVPLFGELLVLLVKFSVEGMLAVLNEA